MNRFKEIFLKVLKKCKILNLIQIHYKIRINGKVFIIPLIYGTGYPNAFLKDDWLLLLVKSFYKKGNASFVDVGANIGQTLMTIKSLENNIFYIGFEPNLSCINYLDKLIKKNNLKNCLVEPYALSDKTQYVYLEKEGETDPRASIINGLRPGYFSGKEKVLAKDFDSLTIQGPISVVKIDVEGAELEVLKGMVKTITRDQPIIVCEVLDNHNDSTFNFTQSRAKSVCQLLKFLHYSIIHIETNSKRNRIISFNQIDDIKIKQWTYDSLRLNDYIFCPLSRLPEVQESISNLI